MYKRIETTLIIVYLLRMFSTESLLRNGRPEGYRVERVGMHGNRVNFTWYGNLTIHSWNHAADMCSGLNSLLPRVNDMRYFYKTLQSDGSISELHSGYGSSTNSVVFYLGDILEATMDYPNIESGERMCLVVEKVPGSQLHLAEPSAIKSCLTPANLLVCKSEIDGGDSSANYDFDSYSRLCNLASDKWYGTLPNWIRDLKQKAEFKQDHICIRNIVFYIALVCSGVVFIILSTSTIILAVRCRRLTHKIKRRQNGIDGINVWSQGGGSEVSSQCHIGETDGKLDILADSTFNRAPGSGFNRESYKEALVNSGYQRISNGRIKSVRASGKKPIY
ncbi:unnamed protein product [Trichobilharzia szidati]|nr:unnamed protein product [Trichobilharzia szidati]